MPKNDDYTLADFERAYSYLPRRERRIAAKEQYRLYSEANPHLILDIHSLKDPTCGDAVHAIATDTNQRAAARRLGVAS